MTDSATLLAMAERLRRLSPQLDMLACEDVLQAADFLSSWANEKAELEEQLRELREKERQSWGRRPPESLGVMDW